jgi:hypothetical protein
VEAGAEAGALVQSKVVHVVLLVTAVSLAVWYRYRHAAIVIAPFLTFWLGGVAEAVATPDAGAAGAAEKIEGVGNATGAAALGFVVFVMLFAVTNIN